MTSKLAIALASLLLLTSCFRGCASRLSPIHLNPNMDSQPSYEPLSESGFFRTGSTSQAPVDGTIARGELRDSDAFYTGRGFFGFASNPLEASEDVVARGRDRFEIYCTPCHGRSGDGRGKLYERSGVESANLRDERIRQMPDGRIFGVVTNGEGLMQGYRFPISPHDRWAIVAYVRELQESP
jgi:mono/diheme cytochrome c family protein